MGFRFQYRAQPLLSRISFVKYRNIIAPKTGQIIPQKISFNK